MNGGWLRGKIAAECRSAMVCDGLEIERSVERTQQLRLAAAGVACHDDEWSFRGEAREHAEAVVAKRFEAAGDARKTRARVGTTALHYFGAQPSAPAVDDCVGMRRGV